MSKNTVVKKILKLGKVDGYGNGRKSCALEVRLEIRQVEPSEGTRDIDLNPITVPYYELSICADVWNNLHTDIIMGGQMYDDLLKLNKSPRVRRIVELWQRWHLNDLKAGTRAQSAYLEEKFPGMTDYTLRCMRLKDADLYK